MKVGEFIVGPKHKPAERTAISEPTSQTEEMETLDVTLKYNIGVLTNNGVKHQDLKEEEEKMNCMNN